MVKWIIIHRNLTERTEEIQKGDSFIGNKKLRVQMKKRKAQRI